MRIDFDAIRARTSQQTEKQTEHRGQIESLVELAGELNGARKIGTDAAVEDAEQAIREDALEVCVRSGWVAQLDGKTKPAEFIILLATGGPAYRLQGKLDAYGQPENVRLMFQDWFKPWVIVPLTEDEQAAALTYASVFYFGE
jgi:hypothetical protein